MEKMVNIMITLVMLCYIAVGGIGILRHDIVYIDCSSIRNE